MHVIILAGGKGTRLASRLNGRPKPLIEIGGRPLLGRQLDTLAEAGTTKAIILVNHAADQIAEYLRDCDWGFEIELIDDGEPRGTAGATLAVLDRLSDTFVVVYGDTLFDIDIAAMRAAHDLRRADATLFLHPNDHPADSDLVMIDADMNVTGFSPYPHPQGAILRNLVNAAFYVVERTALERYRGRVDLPDFGKDLFPLMVKDGARLVGYISHEYIKDIGTPDRLDKASRQLGTGVVARARRSEPQQVIFLDRDGTLNDIVPGDYIRHPDQLTMISGAAAAVKALNDAEYRTVLVTNQPVLARGECTAQMMQEINAKLEVELGRAGAYLDAVYLCPHHPHAGYPGEIVQLKIDCDCRKPATGMIDAAAAAMTIDRARSWLIGDSSTDMLTANRAGLFAMLVATGEGGRDQKARGVPDATVADLGEAARLIIDHMPLVRQRVHAIVGKVRAGDVVLIAGPARSGKTLVGATIRQSLRSDGLASETIALDRWIRPATERGPGGVYSRYAIHDAQVALSPWLEGEATEMALPYYDRFRRARREPVHMRLPLDAITIVEGVPAFALDPGGTRTVHRIYVEAEEGRRAARVIGDLVARGTASKDAEQIYEDRARDETAIIAGDIDRSDYRLTLDDILGTQR